MLALGELMHKLVEEVIEINRMKTTPAHVETRNIGVQYRSSHQLPYHPRVQPATVDEALIERKRKNLRRTRRQLFLHNGLQRRRRLTITMPPSERRA